MAAIGTVLFLCWLNPLLYPLSVVLTPVPVTLVTFRYGGRIGAAALGCTVMGVTLFLGPTNGFLYLGFFGIVGYLTGWLLHTGLDPDRLVLAGGSLVCLYDIIAYYALEGLMGLEDSVGGVKKAMLGWLDTTSTWSDPGFHIAAERLRPAVIDFFQFPLALFFFVALLTFVTNYVICAVVLQRLGVKIPMPPGLLFFRVPAPVAVLALAVAAAGSWTLDGTLIRIFQLNVAFLGYSLLSLGGLSLFLCIMNLTYLAPGYRVVALLLFMVAFPFWSLLGFIDSLFDVRALAASVMG